MSAADVTPRRSTVGLVAGDPAAHTPRVDSGTAGTGHRASEPKGAPLLLPDLELGEVRP